MLLGVQGAVGAAEHRVPALAGRALSWGAWWGAGLGALACTGLNLWWAPQVQPGAGRDPLAGVGVLVVVVGAVVGAGVGVLAATAVLAVLALAWRGGRRPRSAVSARPGTLLSVPVRLLAAVCAALVAMTSVRGAVHLLIGDLVPLRLLVLGALLSASLALALVQRLVRSARGDLGQYPER